MNINRNMNTVAARNRRKSSVYMLVPAEYAIFAKRGIKPKETADMATSSKPVFFLD